MVKRLKEQTADLVADLAETLLLVARLWLEELVYLAKDLMVAAVPGVQILHKEAEEELLKQGQMDLEVESEEKAEMEFKAAFLELHCIMPEEALAGSFLEAPAALGWAVEEMLMRMDQ